jgi:ankyrin repeat protein
MSLLSLPNELLSLIGEYATDSLLNSLALVNRRFYAVFDPLLWHRAAGIYKLYVEPYLREHQDGEQVPGVLRAIQAGNLNAVHKFLRIGVDVNETGPYDVGNLTMLSVALTAEDAVPEMVQLLLSHGADMNLGRNFSSPFAIAVTSHCHPDILDLFFQYRPPLKAVIEGLAHVKCLDIQCRLARYFFANRPIQPDLVVIDKLPGFTRERGISNLLRVACYSGTLEEGEYALSILSNICPQETVGDNCPEAPFCSIKGNNMAMLEWLLQLGLCPNDDRPFGFAPLYYALYRRDIEAANLLRAHGASFSGRQDRNEEFAMVLPVFGAVISGDIDILNYAIDNGAEVCPKHLHGKSTVLWYALRGNQGHRDMFPDEPNPHRSLPMIKRLIELGVPVNALTGPYSRETPIQSAVSARWAAGVQCLLENGAHIDSPAHRLYPPLHTAVQCDQVDCIETLLKHGADPDVVTPGRQNPPLFYVRSVAAAELLLKYGASITKSGSPIPQIMRAATDRGNSDVIALLRRHVDLQVDSYARERSNEEDDARVDTFAEPTDEKDRNR